MDIESRRSVYTAVKDLVDDLRILSINKNPKKPSPYNLYSRLLTHVKIDENDGLQMDKFIKGFLKFFKTNMCYLENNHELVKMPKGTNIVFSERVYLEIQRFIDYIAKKEEKNLTVIRQHLLTIHAIIKPSEEAFAALEETTEDASKMLKKMGIDKKSKEGQLVSNIVEKAQNVIKDVDSSNPQDAILALMTSGGLAEIINTINDGVSDGDATGGLNLRALLDGMQNAVGGIVDKDEGKITES